MRYKAGFTRDGHIFERDRQKDRRETQIRMYMYYVRTCRWLTEESKDGSSSSESDSTRSGAASSVAVPVSSNTELRLVSLPLMDMLKPGRLNRGMLDRDRSEELWGPGERERGREGSNKEDGNSKGKSLCTSIQIDNEKH